jgi:aldose 1-epimerase
MLTLVSGVSSVVVAPEHGAGVIGWMRGSTPMLRRSLPRAVLGGDPHAMGCFPLLPYGNRIGRGCFRWCGTDYVLARNFGDQPHTIHGVGWRRAWRVESASPRSLTLSLDHRPDPSWPFAFAAEIDYALADTGLTVTMQLTNRHHRPAPAGIGVHPQFPRANNPTLRFEATGVWENGADDLPSCHLPVPSGWCHAEARPVALSRLDHCFTGWDGIADIHAGAASLRIEASETFRRLQVFTPSWADFFCIEPVSHVPDSIGRPDLAAEQAMQALQPDATLRGTIRFIPTG